MEATACTDKNEMWPHTHNPFGVHYATRAEEVVILRATTVLIDTVQCVCVS